MFNAIIQSGSQQIDKRTITEV